MSIYIAAKYTAQERIRGIRQRLRDIGYVVTSSWVDEVATDANASPELMLENAKRDGAEVFDADWLFIDTLDESVTGGREVELGMALASGVETVLVGPIRNVFHHVPHYKYPNWEVAIEAMELRLARGNIVAQER